MEQFIYCREFSCSKVNGVRVNSIAWSFKLCWLQMTSVAPEAFSSPPYELSVLSVVPIISQIISSYDLTLYDFSIRLSDSSSRFLISSLWLLTLSFKFLKYLSYVLPSSGCNISFLGTLPYLLVIAPMLNLGSELLFILCLNSSYVGKFEFSFYSDDYNEQ